MPALAPGGLGEPDRPRGVRQIDLVLAEPLEASTRTGDPNGDPRAAVLTLEALGGRLGERRDGTRAVGGHRPSNGCCRDGRRGNERDARCGQQKLVRPSHDLPFVSFLGRSQVSEEPPSVWVEVM